MKSVLLIVQIAAGAAMASFLRLNERIIGGHDVEIGEVPYQASVQYFGIHKCGGTVISSNHVITAAHCTYGYSNPEEFSIRAGTSTLTDGGQVVTISRIYQHPLYDDYTIDFDISVLELAWALAMDVVVPARLPALGAAYPVGTDVRVTGWGTVDSGTGVPSRQLQAVVLQVVDQQDCSDAYVPLSWPVTNRMLCAAAPDGTKDSCQGDSGGPLVVDDVLVGIVSWGYKCAQAGFPGVYAKVSALRDYVKAVANV